MKRSYGRLFSADIRDWKYLLPRRITSARKVRNWNDSGWTGDQGSTPQCVGYAWAHWLAASPIRQLVLPTGIYQHAQYVDEWPGEDYEGTSVRAGAKLLADLGFISNYKWAFTLNPLIQTVLEVGPVVAGTYWYEQMEKPDKNNFISPTGFILGGHAYLISGVNMRKEFFRIKNSWGKSWGDDGHAYITFADMSKLIEEDGEICLGVESKPL